MNYIYKMPNKWTTFVKEWAAKNNMNYASALKNPECKAAYKGTNEVKIDGGNLEGDGKVLKPHITRVGSKMTLLKDIIPLIPPHKIFVELFTGSGAVFWNKNPVDKSVINDLDKDVIQTYRDLKKVPLGTEFTYMDDKPLATIQAFIDRTTPNSSARDRLVAYLKNNKGTYNSLNKGKIYKNTSLKYIENNLEEYKDLLKNTNIRNEDYIKVLKEYDSPSTFFFIDPPYEKSEGLYKNPVIDYEKMRDLLKNIKGKFLLTMNDSKYIRDTFKGFYQVKKNVRSMSNSPEFQKVRKELFIANYPLKPFKKIVGTGNRGSRVAPEPETPPQNIPPRLDIAREQRDITFYTNAIINTAINNSRAIKDRISSGVISGRFTREEGIIMLDEIIATLEFMEEDLQFSDEVNRLRRQIEFLEQLKNNPPFVINGGGKNPKEYLQPESLPLMDPDVVEGDTIESIFRRDMDVIYFLLHSYFQDYIDRRISFEQARIELANIKNEIQDRFFNNRVIRQLIDTIPEYRQAITELSQYMMRWIKEIQNVEKRRIREETKEESKYESSLKESKEDDGNIDGGALTDMFSLKKWGKYTAAIATGRNDYQPKAREIIKKYGNNKIVRMYACRNPVQKLLTAALNAVSFGQFNKNWEKQPYDTLFHLSLRVELDTKPQTTIAIEKTEAVTLTANPPPPNKSMECEFIPLNKRLTLNQLLQGGEAFMGDKYFKYSAKDNNCQDYIMGLLRGSNIGTQENYDFIKQDTKELFKGLPGTRKLSNTITDLGGVMNVVVEGAGVHKGENYYVQSVVFDKTKFNEEQAKDWIIKNNYVLKKADITDTQIRFRQVEPDYIEQMGYKKFRTKKIGRKSGISLIISYK